ncbi:hypothetical protein A2U01_0048725, partial [Trifolium medium]|nr:hypothetical protein [Trifolium medium]
RASASSSDERQKNSKFLASTGDKLAQRHNPSLSEYSKFWSLAKRVYPSLSDTSPEMRLRLEICLGHAQTTLKSSIHHENN